MNIYFKELAYSVVEAGNSKNLQVGRLTEDPEKSIHCNSSLKATV